MQLIRFIVSHYLILLFAGSILLIIGDCDLPTLPSPSIMVTPGTVTLGESDTTGVFYLTIVGVDSDTWSVEEHPRWLSFSPDSGKCTGEPIAIEVTADVFDTALWPGWYVEDITLASKKSGTTAVEVRVNIHEDFILEVYPDSLWLYPDSNYVDTFTLYNAGKGMITWEIESEDWYAEPFPASYLRIDPVQGLLRQGANFSVNAQITATEDDLLSEALLVAPVFYNLSWAYYHIPIKVAGAISNSIGILIFIRVPPYGYFECPGELSFGAQINDEMIQLFNKGNVRLDWTCQFEHHSFVWLGDSTEVITAGSLERGEYKDFFIYTNRDNRPVGVDTARIFFETTFPAFPTVQYDTMDVIVD